MALNIKNTEVERLAATVAQMTGETKTEAIRRALEERYERLHGRARHSAERRRKFLERELWATLNPSDRPLTRAEEDDILGYGAEGV